MAIQENAREDDQCKKLWENAKLDQTHYGDDIQTDMINESIRGERDTKDAMHISTMIKWKMEKFNPRQYGDRAAIVTEECVDRLKEVYRFGNEWQVLAI